MNTYTIYSLSTGQVRCVCTGFLHSVQLQIAPGEAMKEGRPPAGASFVSSEGEWEFSKVSDEKSGQQIASEARSNRDALLASCDWTQLPDADLSENEVEDWRVYRQHLRNITSLSGFPIAFDWPQAPLRGVTP